MILSAEIAVSFSLNDLVLLLKISFISNNAKGRIPTLDEYATIASHEIGHQFELLHFNFDANLMHEDPTYRTNEFCYEYISSIRSIDAP